MSKLVESHINTFGGEPQIFKAPGRVNLIGEHTDYNDGYVLPTPIDRYIWVTINPRQDDMLRLHALDYSEKAQYKISSIIYDKDHMWANYVLGVVESLKKRGHELNGFDMSIQGNVPLGAGLSSSAALETAVVRALNATFSLELNPVEMAYVGKQCENEFVGVQSGIMDQFVSSLGQYGKALFIDCRTNEHSLHTLDPGYQVVILNSMMSRELASSAYNVRKGQCEEAVRILQVDYPEIKALRDVSEEMLLSAWGKLPEIIARRARHVVTENSRVLQTLELLGEGDMTSFGGLMYDSHDSLRHDYEVSSEHLDVLVDATHNIKECLGARMTGAGFGGCTVNIVEEDYVDIFIKTVSERYFNQTKMRCEAYLA